MKTKDDIYHKLDRIESLLMVLASDRWESEKENIPLSLYEWLDEHAQDSVPKK